jgi:hypothetical protein
MSDRRPDGLDDAVVAAAGKTSEAAEYLIRARGALYEFHQLMGHADLLTGDAAQAFEEAGHAQVADDLRDTVVGRNAIDGRWPFQIVEEYDALFYEPATKHLRGLEESLMLGRRHVHESEMKEDRRTFGRPGHEHRPPAAWSSEVETDPANTSPAS